MSSTLDSIIQKTQTRYYACQENERGGRRMLPENAKFFCEALRALRFLHSEGWMHGDLKPQNIGIAYNPLRAVLLDLGSASQVHGAADSSQPRPGGTIPYLSPEREMHDCGMPSDIWAMGAWDFSLPADLFRGSSAGILGATEKTARTCSRRSRRNMKSH